MKILVSVVQIRPRAPLFKVISRLNFPVSEQRATIEKVMAGSLFWDYKGGIDLNQPLGPGQRGHAKTC